MCWEDITFAWGTPQGRPHLSPTYMWIFWHLGMALIHHPRHQKLPASVSSSAMAMSTKGRRAEEEDEKKEASGLDSMRWRWWHGMAMHLKPSRWCNPTTVVVRGDWEEIGGGDACGVGRYRNCERGESNHSFRAFSRFEGVDSQRERERERGVRILPSFCWAFAGQGGGSKTERWWYYITAGGCFEGF